MKFTFIEDKDLAYLTAVNSVAADNNTTQGGRHNKKDGLTRYGNSHVKDKTS